MWNNNLIIFVFWLVCHVAIQNRYKVTNIHTGFSRKGSFAQAKNNEHHRYYP